MKAAARSLGGVALGLGLGLSACGPSYIVVGGKIPVRQPEAIGSPDEAFGRQVRVRSGGYEFNGELLECDGLFVYLHLNLVDDNPYARIPLTYVGEARADVSPTHDTAYAVWLTVGTLSTISHGFWLIFSAPVWTLAGVPAVTASSALRYVDGRCGELIPYARYPAGLPPWMLPRFAGLRRYPLHVSPFLPLPPPDPDALPALPVPPLPPPAPAAPAAPTPVVPPPEPGAVHPG